MDTDGSSVIFVLLVVMWLAVLIFLLLDQGIYAIGAFGVMLLLYVVGEATGWN